MAKQKKTKTANKRKRGGKKVVNDSGVANAL